MLYRPLGRTGVDVSALCYGTMSFGGDADPAASRALYARCREAGINFFDCANTYGRGRAEELLGECIAGERDEVVITSKVGFPMRDGHNGSGLSRRNIVREVEASLRRLRTDRIDVYFAHRFDAGTPIEETLRAFDDLVRAGKILYPAVSNWPAWQVAKALGLCACHGWAPFAVMQPMYNLVKRQVEVELLPLAADAGLAVIPYSPLGGGLLTGKYGGATSALPAADPAAGDPSAPAGRLVANAMYRRRYADPAHWDTAARFAAFARAEGYAPAALAVAWVMHHPAVTAPIIGARSVAQLEDSLTAVAIPMTPDLRAAISALSPTPPIATDRSEEQETPA
jgi:aryl-alcohol dehydrogenase-like predicted oxidoreductase